MLGKNPQWNFIDWSGQRWDDRDTFPSWGKQNGSCLMTAMWVGALRQGAALEAAHGDAGAVEGVRIARPTRARAAIREHCWDAGRGLFADDGDRKVFSQHMNVFAVLYDIATREADARHPRAQSPCRARASTRRPACTPRPTTLRGTWCAPSSTRACAIATSRCSQTWRDLLELNYTTWPESREQPRSDTHAWSAHPTADLLGLVAGIRPAAPGYARLRVAPVLGELTSLDATAATPHGPVSVRYRVANGLLEAEIERPRDLPGEFVWNGRVFPLERVHTRLKLPLR